MDVIRVINHNEGLTLRGRYDGEDYVFPPNKPVDLSFNAAKHIFGIGDEDKSQALNMLGLLIPGRDTYGDALKKLDRVSFHEGKVTFAEEDSVPAVGVDDEEIAEEDQRDAARGRRNRTGGRPHVAGPGGESGAEERSSAPANPSA